MKMAFSPLRQFRPERAVRLDGKVFVLCDGAWLGSSALGAKWASDRHALPPILFRDYWVIVCDDDTPLGAKLRASEEVRLLKR